MTPQHPTVTKTVNLSASGSAQAGLTMIELLIVMAVVAIIAAISVVSVAGVIDRGRQRATMADMRTLSQAIEAYSMDHSEFPDASSGMSGLVTTLASYSRSIPTHDRWGHEYHYVTDSAGNYTLQSLGKDGVDGDDVTPETDTEYERDLVIHNGDFVAAPQ